MSMTITSRKVEGGEWDRLLAGWDGACQEQLYVFAARRFASLRIEPMVFYRDQEAIGGALMLVQRLPLGLAQVAVTKWGPVLRDESAPEAAALYGAMVDALVADYAHKRKMLLSILPRVATGPVNAQYQALLARGFVPGPTLRAPDRYLVDLRLDDQALRKSVEQKWRNRLNKAERSDLVFEHAAPEHLPQFDALFAAMLARKNYKDHSAYETLPALLAHEVQALRCELFFVRHQGEAVAGGVVFKAGDTAVYLYGATADAALPLSAGHFLQFNIIAWLRANTDARWYNLGGNDGNEGLHIFKKGLVGKSGVIAQFPPAASFATAMRAKVFGEMAFAARDRMQAFKRRLTG